MEGSQKYRQPHNMRQIYPKYASSCGANGARFKPLLILPEIFQIVWILKELKFLIDQDRMKNGQSLSEWLTDAIRDKIHKTED